jgi:hypothetical protein
VRKGVQTDFRRKVGCRKCLIVKYLRLDSWKYPIVYQNQQAHEPAFVGLLCFFSRFHCGLQTIHFQALCHGWTQPTQPAVGGSPH